MDVVIGFIGYEPDFQKTTISGVERMETNPNTAFRQYTTIQVKNAAAVFYRLSPGDVVDWSSLTKVGRSNLFTKLSPFRS
jgi:hypothetical protein